MNLQFSKSDDKILDGEGKKNLWERKPTRNKMSEWRGKQAEPP